MKYLKLISSEAQNVLDFAQGNVNSPEVRFSSEANKVIAIKNLQNLDREVLNLAILGLINDKFVSIVNDEDYYNTYIASSATEEIKDILGDDGREKLLNIYGIIGDNGFSPISQKLTNLRCLYDTHDEAVDDLISLIAYESGEEFDMQVNSASTEIFFDFNNDGRLNSQDAEILISLGRYWDEYTTAGDALTEFVETSGYAENYIDALLGFSTLEDTDIEVSLSMANNVIGYYIFNGGFYNVSYAVLDVSGNTVQTGSGQRRVAPTGSTVTRGGVTGSKTTTRTRPISSSFKETVTTTNSVYYRGHATCKYETIYTSYRIASTVGKDSDVTYPKKIKHDSFVDAVTCESYSGPLDANTVRAGRAIGGMSSMYLDFTNYAINNGDSEGLATWKTNEEAYFITQGWGTPEFTVEGPKMAEAPTIEYKEINVDYLEEEGRSMTVSNNWRTENIAIRDDDM